MLTSDSDGYVDLMNPSGLGIAVAVYNYDGKIYASDEGRMLAETGDDYFCIGSVEDKYSVKFNVNKPSGTDLALHMDWLKSYGKQLLENKTFSYDKSVFISFVFL